MTSVFAYRPPTAEDREHLEALQAQMLSAEWALNRVRSEGMGAVPTLEVAVGQLCVALDVHVPDSHERTVAQTKLTLFRVMAREAARLCFDANAPQWTPVVDYLRECRMWANAGIVLVR